MNKEITQLLSDYSLGDNRALDALFPMVYEELRLMAHHHLRKSWSMETVCATALINEAYLKLVARKENSYANRAHFFAVSATAMRQIIINYAERKNAQKRGLDWQRVTFDDALVSETHSLELLTTINDALSEIEEIDAALARLVELRFFAGMTEAEIALITAVSERTVRRRWRKAKALLMKVLAD